MFSGPFLCPPNYFSRYFLFNDNLTVVLYTIGNRCLLECQFEENERKVKRLMYEKRMLISAAMLLLTARGTCQTGPHPLMGPLTPPPTAGSFPLGGSSPAKPPARSATPLTAMLQPGETTVGAGAVLWNAGAIDEGRQNHVEHTFTLKNTNSQSVTVSRLRGSCGCETLFLTQGGKEAPTVKLAPNETVQVRVSVALHSGQSGEMHKYAWAYGPEASSPPLASLELVMTVRAPVVFKPDILDFGHLSVGVPQSVTMRVTADTEVLAGQPVPTPISDQKTVTVTPAGPEISVMQDGKAAKSRRFRVTLSAPLESGTVTGSLSLPAPAGSALAATRLPLAGTVSGTMTAQPESVFFGSIPGGQSFTRQVLLSESSTQHGKALSVSSSSAWLTAVIQETGGTKPLLVVTLKPGAPVGPLQSAVVVTSASGERLSIPVVGEVLGHHL
jgi:hypothetical protein